MDMFESAILKVKDIFDVAAKKTGEVVALEKQRFDLASLRSKREKDFAKLGRLYYDKIKNCDDIPDNERELADLIKQKTTEIIRLNSEIAEAKNKTVCPGCGTAVSENSVFCNLCGFKIFD